MYVYLFIVSSTKAHICTFYHAYQQLYVILRNSIEYSTGCGKREMRINELIDWSMGSPKYVVLVARNNFRTTGPVPDIGRSFLSMYLATNPTLIAQVV